MISRAKDNAHTMMAKAIIPTIRASLPAKRERYHVLFNQSLMEGNDRGRCASIQACGRTNGQRVALHLEGTPIVQQRGRIEEY